MWLGISSRIIDGGIVLSFVGSKCLKNSLFGQEKECSGKQHKSFNDKVTETCTQTTIKHF